MITLVEAFIFNRSVIGFCHTWPADDFSTEWEKLKVIASITIWILDTEGWSKAHQEMIEYSSFICRISSTLSSFQLLRFLILTDGLLESALKMDVGDIEHARNGYGAASTLLHVHSPQTRYYVSHARSFNHVTSFAHVYISACTRCERY